MSVQTIFRKFGNKALIVFIVITSIIGTYFIIHQLFRITRIEIVGEDTQVQIDQERFPKNLLFFPSERVSQQLLRENPLLASASIKKKFPNTLVIITSRRKIQAKLETNGQVIPIAKGGVITQDGIQSDMPSLQFDIGVVHIGDTIDDKRVLRSLLLVEYLHLERISSIRDWNSQSLVAKIGKIDIIFAQDGDIPSIAATLQTLLNGFRIKGTMPTLIDLRFEKPIITF